MDAQIVIDLQTGTPPYEQIQTQISSLIAVGELPLGTRLPTVRALAADLGVAAGTVARAYKELEAAGMVTTNRRQGTVVAESGTWLAGSRLAGSRQARPPEAGTRLAGSSQAGSRQARPPGAGARPPEEASNSGEVMAAVDHLINVGEAAGLDGKTILTLLQGRLSQRGK